MHESFFRRNNLAMWVWGVFCFLGAAELLEVVEIAITSGQTFGMAAIAVSLFLGISVIWLLRWLDVLDQEPLGNVVAVVLWGGLAAGYVAGYANESLGVLIGSVVTESSGWLWAIVAPINEELLKGLGVALIIVACRKDIHGVMDGVFYGAMAGLGFEVVENIYYYVSALQAAGGAEITAGIDILALRTYYAFASSHMAFTAIAGAGLAYAATASVPTTRKVLVATGLLLTAGVLHSFWNSPIFQELGDSPLYILRGVPALVALVAVLMWVSKHEVALALATAKKLPKGLVLKEEVPGLVNPVSRIAAAIKRTRMPARERKRQIQLRNAQLAVLRAVMLGYEKKIVDARIKAVRVYR
jgi:RsiW-degrading membrane proteinase PrsW (M82 family)